MNANESALSTQFKAYSNEGKKGQPVLFHTTFTLLPKQWVITTNTKSEQVQVRVTKWFKHFQTGLLEEMCIKNQNSDCIDLNSSASFNYIK